MPSRRHIWHTGSRCLPIGRVCWLSVLAKTQNTNLEIRNKLEIPNSKPRLMVVSQIRISSLFRISKFEVRAFFLLHSPFFGWPAAVVGQGSDVLDGLDGKAGRLKRGDRRLTTGPGALDPHFDLLDAKLGRLLRRRFRGTLGSKRCALAAALEAHGPG